jgi:hypothetical protein
MLLSWSCLVCVDKLLTTYCYAWNKVEIQFAQKPFFREPIFGSDGFWRTEIVGRRWRRDMLFVRRVLLVIRRRILEVLTSHCRHKECLSRHVQAHESSKTSK